MDGRLSCPKHRSRFHGLLNHYLKRGAPCLGKALTRSRDPGVPPLRLPRTPFGTAEFTDGGEPNGCPAGECLTIMAVPCYASREGGGFYEFSETRALARISHHGLGRAGLQPRRYRPITIVSESRAPHSLQPQAVGGAGRTRGGSRDFGGAEAPPFRQTPKSVSAW